MASSRTLFLGLACAASIVACGQITGLSDDYKYDLATDGSAGDGGKQDGATDGATANDGSSSQCGTAQVTAANTILATQNGTQECKSCLAAECCTDVTSCATQSDCKNELACDLDCTTKEQNSRQSCFRGCTENGVPSSYGALNACADKACRQQCGFP